MIRSVYKSLDCSVEEELKEGDMEAREQVLGNCRG